MKAHVRVRGDIMSWHWLPNSRRLSHGDDRLVVDGETLEVPHNRPLKICRYGLHAAKTPIDVLLAYVRSDAPPAVLCHVVLLGAVEMDGYQLDGHS